MVHYDIHLCQNILDVPRFAGRVLQGSASLRSARPTRLRRPFCPLTHRRRARVTPGILPVMPPALSVAFWSGVASSDDLGRLLPPKVGGSESAKQSKASGWLDGRSR